VKPLRFLEVSLPCNKQKLNTIPTHKLQHSKRESKKNSQEEELATNLFCLGASYLRSGKGQMLERAAREVRVAAVGGGSEEVMIDLAMRMSKL
jgi:hypothetical protein